jgi:hypothetical protein
MRIIGGKDYYDSASAYGIDPGIVFVRHEIRLTNADMDRIGRYVASPFFIRPDTDEDQSFKAGSLYRQGFLTPDLRVQLYSPIIIFCGKIYSGIFVTVIEGREPNEVKTEYRFWNEEKFNNFLAERGWRLETMTYYGHYGYQKLDERFAAINVKGDALKCLLEKRIVCVTYKEPQLALAPLVYRSNRGIQNEESDWVANSDSLKDWDFQKVFDPVSAFQEIAQWVGGTLASYGPEIVEIKDDLVKAHKAGFDTKTSFRRPKQVK